MERLLRLSFKMSIYGGAFPAEWAFIRSFTVSCRGENEYETLAHYVVPYSVSFSLQRRRILGERVLNNPSH